MSIGEVGLSKLVPQDPLNYIVFDVNDALRRTYLSRSLTVIGHALKSASSSATSSEVYELPGRNNFLLQIVAANSTTPSGFTVKIQGSLTGNPNIATDWNDVTSHNNLGFHVATDNTPYRFYRVYLANGTTSGSIDVHLSAIAY
jgi:hypothetical protein